MIEKDFCPLLDKPCIGERCVSYNIYGNINDYHYRITNGLVVRDDLFIYDKKRTVTPPPRKEITITGKIFKKKTTTQIQDPSYTEYHIVGRVILNTPACKQFPKFVLPTKHTFEQCDMGWRKYRLAMSLEFLKSKHPDDFKDWE